MANRVASCLQLSCIGQRSRRRTELNLNPLQYNLQNKQRQRRRRAPRKHIHIHPVHMFNERLRRRGGDEPVNKGGQKILSFMCSIINFFIPQHIVLLGQCYYSIPNLYAAIGRRKSISSSSWSSLVEKR